MSPLMLELNPVLPPCKRNAVPLPRLSTQSMPFTITTVLRHNNQKYNTLTVKPTGSLKQLVPIGVSSSQRLRQLWDTPSLFTW